MVPCNNKESFNDEVNTVIDNVTTWLCRNNLQVNINKTTYVQFVNKNGNKQALSVRYRDDTVVESTKATFLGIVLDDKCSWVDHIDKLCSRINPFGYALWRLTKVSSEKVALQAYHGYVCSLLRYGVILWGNASQVNRVFVAQKQCVRAICDINIRTSCRPFFIKLQLLTFPCIYIFEMCVFVKTHPDLFKRRGDDCSYNTRYPERLMICNMRTTLYSKNCYSMAVKLFNRLSNDIKLLPINLFKNKLKKWLIINCFYSVDEYLHMT